VAFRQYPASSLYAANTSMVTAVRTPRILVILCKAGDAIPVAASFFRLPASDNAVEGQIPLLVHDTANGKAQNGYKQSSIKYSLMQMQSNPRKKMGHVRQQGTGRESQESWVCRNANPWWHSRANPQFFLEMETHGEHSGLFPENRMSII